MLRNSVFPRGSFHSFYIFYFSLCYNFFEFLIDLEERLTKEEEKEEMIRWEEEEKARKDEERWRRALAHRGLHPLLFHRLLHIRWDFYYICWSTYVCEIIAFCCIATLMYVLRWYIWIELWKFTVNYVWTELWNWSNYEISWTMNWIDQLLKSRLPGNVLSAI